MYPRNWLEGEGDRLYYGLGDVTRPAGYPREGDARAMLDRFCRLTSAEGVRRFAVKYGVLGICEEHKLPASHNPRPTPRPSSGAVTWCSPSGWGDRNAREGFAMWDPIDRWLHYARLANGLLAISVPLHEGRPAPAALWETVFEDHAADAENWADVRTECAGLAKDVGIGRSRLAHLVQEWLATAGVGVSFTWPMDSPAPSAPRFGAGTFGILGIQLALTISQTTVSVCSRCQQRYARTDRAPAHGRRNFCGACRSHPDPGGALRLQAMRERDRQIRELLDRGLSAGAVATKLHYPIEQVRGAAERRKKKRELGYARQTTSKRVGSKRFSPLRAGRTRT